MAKRKKKGPVSSVFDAEELLDLGYDPNNPDPPKAWPEFDETIVTDCQCPRCGYRWSSGEDSPEDLG